MQWLRIEFFKIVYDDTVTDPTIHNDLINIEDLILYASLCSIQKYLLFRETHCYDY